MNILPRTFSIVLRSGQHDSLKRRYLSSVNAKSKKSVKWESVVGLEIHAQLNSKSKLFSGASTEFGSLVNNNVALFDAATPGTLPCLNRSCVELGVKTALALSCKVNPISYFDRKHYFYADLPAGYQITQQRLPLAQDGFIEFQVAPNVKRKIYSKKSKLKQIQLEQDSGKSLHDYEANRSLIDLNRAGVPLAELVFEPDLTDGEEAAALVKELCIILTRLKTCSCRMEEGALRVDANISVNKPGSSLGVRTEIKNLGSVRAVANAVDYEIQRQIEELEKGRLIVNETRGWDALSGQTVPMRDKEAKQDYRFMPEPNLPPLRVNLTSSISDSLINVKSLAEALPELPNATRDRLKTAYNLPSEMIYILVNDELLLQLFSDVINGDRCRNPKTTCKILVNELLAVINKESASLSEPKWNSKTLGEIVDLVSADEINLATARFLLEEIANDNPNSPKEIVDKLGLAQISDEKVLQDLCRLVIDENPKMVAQYKSGKSKVFAAFLGLIARRTKERANMKRIVDILKKMLSD